MGVIMRSRNSLRPRGAVAVAAVATTLFLAGGVAAQEEEQGFPFEVQSGPLTAQLGALATIDVPEGVAFVAEDQMEAFNAATGNLHSERDVGALIADEG